MTQQENQVEQNIVQQQAPLENLDPQKLAAKPGYEWKQNKKGQWRQTKIKSDAEKQATKERMSRLREAKVSNQQKILQTQNEIQNITQNSQNDMLKQLQQIQSVLQVRQIKDEEVIRQKIQQQADQQYNEFLNWKKFQNEQQNKQKQNQQKQVEEQEVQKDIQQLQQVYQPEQIQNQQQNFQNQNYQNNYQQNQNQQNQQRRSDRQF